MGAGKGYVMNWMSLRDILPLKEVVVHVDADRFKEMMPEWPEYLRRDKRTAGSMCHKESGLLAELAQELAMDQSFNVWVDGSLRDFEWHAQKIREIRNRHPHYRIALFYVHAPEATVRRRVKMRAARLGGRDVPEDVLAASLAAPAHTLRALTPMVDFVARILNEDEPVLETMETIDTSGDWNRIADMFGSDAMLGFDRAQSSANLLRRPRSSFSSMQSSDQLDALATTTHEKSGGAYSFGGVPANHGLSAMMARDNANNSNSNGAIVPTRKSSTTNLAALLRGRTDDGEREDVSDLLDRCRRESRLLRARCDDDAKTIANLQSEIKSLRQQVHSHILAAAKHAANHTDDDDADSSPRSPLACFTARGGGERMPPSEDRCRDRSRCFFW